MTELLSKFDSGELIGLVALIGGMFLGTLGIILAFCWNWQVHRRAEIMAGLKQDMLNRGMSAEQIQMVLEAGIEESGKSSKGPSRNA
jgi:hypothetical protein